jgi:hypothetical protein
MKIELTYEQEDRVIVKSLKMRILEGTGDYCLTSMLEVLSYYTTPYEYETFVRKNNL